MRTPAHGISPFILLSWHLTVLLAWVVDIRFRYKSVVALFLYHVFSEKIKHIKCKADLYKLMAYSGLKGYLDEQIVFLLEYKRKRLSLSE